MIKHIYKHEGSFEFEAGGSIDNLEVAYHTSPWGYSPDKKVIWLCHALTADSDPEGSWWPALVGPGKLIDTEKYFVICANVLGSACGSSGPVSTNPKTGKPYYFEFPRVTVRDTVRAFDLLRQHLGIEKIDVLIGTSMGGFMSFEWAVMRPGIFGKIFFILFLARYLDRSQNSDSQLRRFIAATAILLVPMGLILVQPDLGTASVYIPVFLLMCFIAGIPLRYIMYILLMGIMTIVFAIAPVWNTEIAKTPHAAISILTDMRLRMILVGASAAISLIGFAVRRYFRGAGYWFWLTYITSIITVSLVMSVVLGKVLKYYQIKRLIVFMDPQTDPLGSGWNIIQSKIAIGAGGIFGRGYLNGTQSHYRFLPQQSTDFIFSILSEELGFAGGCMVFFLYFLIFMRILRIMKKTPNRYGLYILAGILAMFSFHFFINVGMVMGMMPITGIPLLFLSYGGSSLLSAMTCVGLIMSISSRRGLK